MRAVRSHVYIPRTGVTVVVIADKKSILFKKKYVLSITITRKCVCERVREENA